MNSLLNKSTQKIIFEIIKQASPFKTPIKNKSTNSQQKKINLFKVYDNNNNSGLSKQSLTNKEKISKQKQRVRKVTFIQQPNKEIIITNPQQQQKQRQYEQKYNKQKQYNRINRCIRQIRSNVNQLVNTLTSNHINIKKQLLLNKNKNTINRRDSNNTINRRDSNKSITKLITYRHLLQLQDNKSTSMRQYKCNIQSSQSNKQTIFTPINRSIKSQKSFNNNQSQKILSQRKLMSKSSMFNRSLSSLKLTNKQVQTNQNNNNNNISISNKSTITTINNSNNNKSLQTLTQYYQQKSINHHNPSYHNNLSSSSTLLIKNNRWRHQIDIELLKHKLLSSTNQC